MQLTPNFHLKEFLKPSDTPPPQGVIDNLQRLAERLQVLRDILGRPIKINSGYRSPEYNKQIGGAANSYHVKGMAADLQIGSEAQKLLRLDNWSGGYGKDATWCHLDIRPEKARWSY